MYCRTMEIGADLSEDGTQPTDGVAIEHSAAIFRHKDQVNVHLENAVPSMSNFVVIAHKTKSMIKPCNYFKPTSTN